MLNLRCGILLRPCILCTCSEDYAPETQEIIFSGFNLSGHLVGSRPTIVVGKSYSASLLGCILLQEDRHKHVQQAHDIRRVRVCVRDQLLSDSRESKHGAQNMEASILVMPKGYTW